MCGQKSIAAKDIYLGAIRAAFRRINGNNGAFRALYSRINGAISERKQRKRHTKQTKQTPKKGAAAIRDTGAGGVKILERTPPATSTAAP